MNPVTAAAPSALTAKCPHCPEGAPPVPASQHQNRQWLVVDCPKCGKSNVKADGSPRETMAEPAATHQAFDPRTTPPPAPPAAPIPDELAPVGSLPVGSYVVCPDHGDVAVIKGSARGSSASRVSGSHVEVWCNVGRKHYPNHVLVRPLPESEHPAEAPDPRPAIERGRS